MDHAHAEGAQKSAVHLRTRPLQVVDTENRDSFPEFKEGLRQNAADEATYAGDEDSHPPALAASRSIQLAPISLKMLCSDFLRRH
jgi:hypothetical protein